MTISALPFGRLFQMKPDSAYDIFPAYPQTAAVFSVVAAYKIFDAFYFGYSLDDKDAILLCDDDVTNLRFPEQVSQLVHNDIIAFPEGRLHAFVLDFEAD